MTKYDEYLSVSFSSTKYPTPLEGLAMSNVMLDNFSSDIYEFVLERSQQDYPGADVAFGDGLTLDIIAENGVVGNVRVDVGVSPEKADEPLYDTGYALSDLQKFDWEQMYKIETAARENEADFSKAVESLSEDTGLQK